LNEVKFKNKIYAFVLDTFFFFEQKKTLELTTKLILLETNLKKSYYESESCKFE